MKEIRLYQKLKKIYDITKKLNKTENIYIKKLSLQELKFIISSVLKQVPATIHLYEEEDLQCPSCKENIGYYIIGKDGADAIGYCSYCGQKLKFTKK